MSTQDSMGFAWEMLFGVSYALRLAFLTLALFVLIRSRSDDLVASRRSLRGLLLMITGGYILIVLLVELTLGNRAAPPLLETVHSGLMAAVLMVVAVWFLIANPASLFATYAKGRRGAPEPTRPVRRTMTPSRQPARLRLPIPDCPFHPYPRTTTATTAVRSPSHPDR